MKYKQYQKMKDSGVEWIGEIPEHWEVNKIKFTSYVKGRIGWQGLTTREYIDEGPYLITGTDFQDGKINWKTCHHVEQWRYEQDPYIQIKNNDILITKDGTIGKIAIVDDPPGDTTLNSGVMVVRPLNNHFIPKYLNWILNSSLFTDFINYIKSGTTINHLYQEEFGKFVFPIPEQDEQEQISKFLFDGTTVFDGLISKSQSQINLLEEKRQATITQAVTKGLDPTVPMKDSGVEWIGEIPEHWEVQKLNHLKKEGTSITYGIVQPGPDVEEGVPYIQATDMKGIFSPKKHYKKTSQAIANQYSRSQVHEGEIIMAIRATIGNAMIIPDFLDGANIDRGPAKISPGNNINGRFLLYYLNSLTTQQYIKSELLGATITGITLELLRKLIVTCPPKEEQNQISEFLKKQTTQFDDLISKSQSQINLLEEKRQALITAAVTGKIDVRNGIA